MICKTAHTLVFRLIGGHLCLDFVNTMHNYGGNPPRDELASYAVLVAWSQQVGIVRDSQAQHLLREAARRAMEADNTLNRAKGLRDALYSVFSAIAADRAVQSSDLSVLKEALSGALKHLQIMSTPQGFAWDWIGTEGTLEWVLWPLAQSAVELLTSVDLKLVRECAGDDCSWLFLDTSRNHRRRWCDMKDCGNRAKARRHYERVKRQKAQVTPA
jgi:predicted RNA-binding Zn ribbon-like protein